MTVREALYAALCELRRMAPDVPYPEVGICSNLSIIDRNVKWGALENGIVAWLVHMGEYHAPMTEEEIAYRVNYPVEHCHDEYLGTDKWANGPYTERRMNLLDFLIEYYNPESINVH